MFCSHSLAYPGEGFPPLHVVAFLLFGLAACGPLAVSKPTTGGCSQSSKSDSGESSLWISFKADDTPLVLNDAPNNLLYNREMNLHEVLILLTTASVHYILLIQLTLASYTRLLVTAVVGVPVYVVCTYH